MDCFVHDLLEGPQFVIKSLAESCYINLVVSRVAVMIGNLSSERSICIIACLSTTTE